MTTKVKLTAAALALTAATASHAATINPADFDEILTEGKRTLTIDNVDVSGNPLDMGANGNVDTANLGSLTADDSLLLVGRVTEGTVGDDVFGTDTREFDSVEGAFNVSILGLTYTSRVGNQPRGPFEVMIDLFVDNVLVESLTFGSDDPDEVLMGAFGPLSLSGESVEIVLTGTEGRSDYDIALNRPAISAVPLPAGGLLLLGGLGGFAAMRRRKKS